MVLALLLVVTIAAAKPAPAEPPDTPPPEWAAARATVRRWLRALVRGNLPAAEQETALPFTVVTDGFRGYLPPSQDPPGQARTPTELRERLARVRRNTREDLTAYLEPPSRATHRWLW